MGSYNTFSSILSLTKDHNTLMVPAKNFDDLKFHNEFKGETREGEIQKWRDKIKSIYGILSSHDEVTGNWYFKHKDSKS